MNPFISVLLAMDWAKANALGDCSCIIQCIDGFEPITVYSEAGFAKWSLPNAE